MEISRQLHATAVDDLEAVKVLLAGGKNPQVVFYFQQAVEKALKSVGHDGVALFEHPRRAARQSLGLPDGQRS